MVTPPDYNSPLSLKSYMDSMCIAMRKQYGQNFLINPDARKRLIKAVTKESTPVWEVGPGLGCMTKELLATGAKVTVFEIDKAFVTAIKSFFPDAIRSGQLSVVEGDVLKTLPSTLTASPAPVLFGNLPYNIAATLIASTIEKSAAKYRAVPFDRCVITVQKEVAERMASVPGSKDYSSLSVVCQWAYKIHALMDISPASFWPRPRVSSRSLVFQRQKDFPRCLDASLFVRLVRSLFASRRKTIRNNLSPFLGQIGCSATAEEVLGMAGIDKNIRAETLDTKTLLHLSDILATAIGG